MIKVLHIVSDTNVGGAGKLLLNCLKNFDRTRFLVKVVLPKNSQLQPMIAAEGYETIEICGNADKSLDFHAISELKQVFRAEKPDIVHTHSSMSGKIAAYLAGVKARLYTKHCAFEPPAYLTKFPGKQLNGFVNNTLSTKVIAVAQVVKDTLVQTGIRADKIEVIINGSDGLCTLSPEERATARAALGIAEGDFVLGICARLEALKGHRYFLEAAKLLCGRHSNVKFLIIGTGSEEAALKAQAEALGIADRVIFTGFLEDVTVPVNCMDLNINCSYESETSSLALSEGMSVGKPAVVTNCGGNPYMVEDGQTGFLVPMQDAAALAEAAEKLLCDPELYGRMSRAAKERYETRFTAGAMTRALEAVYEQEIERIHGRKEGR